jgi:hypothetical protein
MEDSTTDNKKSQQAFDISTKSPVTNVFSGEGQQVAIQNSGETLQQVEQGILSSSDLTSIVPDEDSSSSVDNGDDSDNSDNSDDSDNMGTKINQLSDDVKSDNQSRLDAAAAGAPSITGSIITDTDRADRYSNPDGQKALAEMLTIANIEQFLTSDIDYILGLGPLLSSDGEELAAVSDISDTPEYSYAKAVLTNYIDDLSEDEKQDPDILKWQKQIGLL